MNGTAFVTHAFQCALSRQSLKKCSGIGHFMKCKQSDFHYIILSFLDLDSGTSHKHKKSAPHVLISQEICGFQMACRPLSFDNYSDRVVSP